MGGLKQEMWSLFMEGHFVRGKVVCATVWSVCLCVGNICVGQKTCVGVCGQGGAQGDHRTIHSLL